MEREGRRLYARPSGQAIDNAGGMPNGMIALRGV
jgi:hypothetical protein